MKRVVICILVDISLFVREGQTQTFETDTLRFHILPLHQISAI